MIFSLKIRPMKPADNGAGGPAVILTVGRLRVGAGLNTTRIRPPRFWKIIARQARHFQARLWRLQAGWNVRPQDMPLKIRVDSA